MASNTIVFTIANVLETGFLIAIVVEFVKIFTSKGKSGSSASDAVVAASKKLFGKSDEQIAKQEAMKAKKAEELKERNAELEEIGRVSAGLAVDASDKMQVLFQGTQNLKDVRGKPQFVELTPEISSKVVAPMMDASVKIENDYKKIGNTGRTALGNLLNNMEKDVQEISQDMDNELKVAEKELEIAIANKKSVDASAGVTPAEKNYAQQKVDSAEANAKKLRDFMHPIKEETAKLSNQIKSTVLPSEKTLSNLSNNAKIRIHNIQSALKTINESTKDLSKADPKTRGAKVAAYDNSVKKLSEEVPLLKSIIDAMVVDEKKIMDEINSKLAPEVQKLYNAIKASMTSRKPLSAP